MIGRVLRRFAKATAGRELKAYLEKVDFGGDDQLARILGHAALVYADLVRRHPVVDGIIRSPSPVQEGRLGELVLMTTGMVKAYQRTGQRLNAAGMMLWNQSLRCLCHPELSDYGALIWSRFMQVSALAEGYLESLRGVQTTELGDVVQGDIDAAKRICHLSPTRLS